MQCAFRLDRNLFDYLLQHVGTPRPSKPGEGIDATERVAEREENVVDVVAALLAGGHAAGPPEPGRGPLKRPAVAAEAVAGVGPRAGDADLNAPPGQRTAAVSATVGLVSVRLGRALAPAPVRLPDWQDRVDQVLERRAVVAVGAIQAERERGTASVDHNMTLRARFAAIRRIRPRRAAPFWRGRWRCPGSPGSSRSGRHRRGGPIAPGAGSPTAGRS